MLFCFILTSCSRSLSLFDSLQRTLLILCFSPLRAVLKLRCDFAFVSFSHATRIPRFSHCQQQLLFHFLFRLALCSLLPSTHSVQIRVSGNGHKLIDKVNPQHLQPFCLVHLFESDLTVCSHFFCNNSLLLPASQYTYTCIHHQSFLLCIEESSDRGCYSAMVVHLPGAVLILTFSLSVSPQNFQYFPNLFQSSRSARPPSPHTTTCSMHLHADAFAKRRHTFPANIRRRQRNGAAAV